MMYRNWKEGHWRRRPLVGIVFIVVAVTVLGTSAMLLWNWLMPALFGTPAITFAQVLGLSLLARIVLGHGTRHRRHMGSSHWSNNWHGEGGHEHPDHGEEPDTPASESA